jgi:hypothetical protein
MGHVDISVLDFRSRRKLLYGIFGYKPTTGETEAERFQFPFLNQIDNMLP